MPPGDIIAVIEPEIHPHEVAERAAWLARINECKLELLLCDPDYSSYQAGWLLSSEAEKISEQIASLQRGLLEDLADNVRDADVTVTTEVMNHRPLSEGIIQRVKERNPRFLVKGTQHHSAAERSILLHIDWQLIRSCPCPLYLAKPKSVSEQPVIVAAVDPTHEHDKPAALDDVIVRAAQDIAKRTGGDVHLLHTYFRLSAVGSEVTRTVKPIELSIDKLDQRIKLEHRKKLDALAAAHEVDEQYVHQLPGRTQDIAPMFCRTHNVDIVVMGAIARWGVKRAIIGSTTERLLDQLPSDIVVVRSPSEDDVGKG